MGRPSFCIECGARLGDKGAFCGSCGARVDEPVSVAPVETEREPEPTAELRADPAPVATVEARREPEPVREPPPATATAPREAATPAGMPSSNVRYGPVIGALAVAFSALLAWFGFAGAESATAFDLPVQMLFSSEAAEGTGFNIGLLLLGAGLVAAAMSFRPDHGRVVRRICGVASIAIVALFVFRIQESFGEFDVPLTDVLGTLGVGVYLALGGGVVLVLDR